MAFQDLYNELTGQVPGLDPLLARKLINRAWRDICESRLWTFNTAETVLIAPSIANTGTVSVTQYANPGTVVGDATAAAAWVAMTLTVPITTRQFRVGTGPIYNITAFDGVDTLTLDRTYTDSTASGQAYSIYKCYYSVPSTNFLRWVDVFDPLNAYAFASTTLTSDQIDRIDPIRGALGMPYYLAAYKPDANSVMQYEMWPHPTSAIGYKALYEVRGSDFATATESQPPAIPDELLVERGMFHACQTMAQKVLAENRPAQAQMWMALAREHNLTYQTQLRKLKRQDEETALKNYSTRLLNPRSIGINTGAYLASHDIGEFSD